LAKDGSSISESLELGTSLPFDVTAKLKESLERSLQRAQDLIAAEEQRVTSLLDDFVTDEVSERIDEVRSKVSDVWGAGTTRNQSAEVQGFYREVKQLLSGALVEHLNERSQTFGGFLLEEAKTAPRDALDEVHVLLEQAADNIRAAAEALVAGQKDAIETLVSGIKAEQQEVLNLAEQLLQTEVSPENSSKVGDLPEPIPCQVPVSVVTSSTSTATPTEIDATNTTVTQQSTQHEPPLATSTPDGDWSDEVQQAATVTVERLRLRDGANGWPFDKVFPQRCLEGVMNARLIDPYLSKPHQIRNLNDFLLHFAESAHPRSIEVITGFTPDEFAARQERDFEDAARDLFKNYGVTLTLRREPGLHDRYLVLDHGVLFKLGRGLDIYKPAVGLAEHRPGNRRVRETDVDVFCRPGHALAKNTDSRAA
jgi:hypothetical protein